MNKQHLTLFGLKFHPFRPGVPLEALMALPAVDSFCRRVEFSMGDGGYVMITGDPGTGALASKPLGTPRLGKQRDVVVGTIAHPQSRVSDFYRELGDIFSLNVGTHNRWGGFKALREKWSEHIQSTRIRPVLIIDEAQEMLSTVFNELRILSSKEFDSDHLLCVVFAGDARLPDRFRHPDLLPLGSRIRRRLQLDYAPREDLLACLDHLLDAAGNSALMTSELKATVAEHAAGNYRIMMNIGDELLAAAAERDQELLDEKLFLELFAPPAKQKPARKRGA